MDVPLKRVWFMGLSCQTGYALPVKQLHRRMSFLKEIEIHVTSNL